MANEECRLSLLTLNLWNDKENRLERMQAFFNLVQEYNPDVICLQEVTNMALQKILRQSWAKMYFASTKKINLRETGHGEVVLSKFPISLNETFPFKQTTVGNCINITHINIPLNYILPTLGEEDTTGDSITLLNCQLEKLKPFSETRKEQFRSLINLVCNESNVVFTGDTNFTDEDLDILDIPMPWKDAWVELGEQLEFQYTYDSTRNKYITGHGQYRFDRVIYKSPYWMVEYLETVGIDDVVSTHFGIYCEFTKRS